MTGRGGREGGGGGRGQGDTVYTLSDIVRNEKLSGGYSVNIVGFFLARLAVFTIFRAISNLLQFFTSKVLNPLNFARFVWLTCC